jgi:hypothetical protein
VLRNPENDTFLKRTVFLSFYLLILCLLLHAYALLFFALHQHDRPWD